MKEARPHSARARAPAGILRPAWVEVDLDALEHNLELLRRRVGPARILAVVKADAYGHGAPRVGRFLEESGVHWLGVALLEEGVELRRAGVNIPILVLGTAHRVQLPLYRRYRLTPTISSLEQLDLWRGWVTGTGAQQAFHLKVDTGMTRLGIGEEEVERALEVIRETPGLELRGILSHFAEAEDLESPRNPQQEGRFAQVLERLTPDERGRVEIHMANSAAAIHRPESRHTLVRFGLALFGLDPAGGMADLRPVMSAKAHLVHLREVPAGTRLGYGGRRVTTRPSRVAVVPVGYADGYSWRLSDRAYALIGGQRVPVAGAVSMDMTLLDVTDTDARRGDETVLLGRQGGEEVTVRELANLAGTTPYEILCLLGIRLPCLYLRGGEPEDLASRFRP